MAHEKTDRFQGEMASELIDAKRLKAPNPKTADGALKINGPKLYPTLSPEIARLILVGFKADDFGEGKPLGIPPLQDGLNYLPPPKLGEWDPYKIRQPGCRPYPEVNSMAGYDYYETVVAHFGLVSVHTAHGGRIHKVVENPERPGWVTFYAGTIKCNTSLKNIYRYVRFVHKSNSSSPGRLPGTNAEKSLILRVFGLIVRAARAVKSKRYR